MAKQGVRVNTHHEVTAIDPQARVVSVRNLQSPGESVDEFAVTYDRLVIATGARAVEPALPGADLEGVFALRSLDNGLDIQRFLSERKPTRAVVIGGGYIGVEMAETFVRLGLDVTMLIRSGKPMRSTLDDDVRELLTSEMERHGVEIVSASPISFEGNGRLAAVLTAERRYSCDIALLGMGARPNVEMAHTAGVSLGATGAIATDTYMRTNLPDVFAAGDCAEALHLVTGQPDFIPLGSTANKQGRVAGMNAAGGNATFGGVVGTMVVRAFDLAVARTGLTTTQAEKAGFSPRGTMIRAKDVSHYFPGAADMHVKLVYDGDTDRLLGGQIVGQQGTAKRIDVLATALHCKLTVAVLRRLDLAYAPPFAPVWDPILVAANVAGK
jgi:NADPH-dependent 2,4-dienoyl-CoA reductase/sulfur reductase-like enzyme